MNASAYVYMLLRNCQNDILRRRLSVIFNVRIILLMYNKQRVDDFITGRFQDGHDRACLDMLGGGVV